MTSPRQKHLEFGRNIRWYVSAQDSRQGSFGPSQHGLMQLALQYVASRFCLHQSLPVFENLLFYFIAGGWKLERQVECLASDPGGLRYPDTPMFKDAQRFCGERPSKILSKRKAAHPLRIDITGSAVGKQHNRMGLLL